MNKHIIEHMNKSEYQMPIISKEINANVVADARFKTRTNSGGYVAWPSTDNSKTEAQTKVFSRVYQWFKTLSNKSGKLSFR
jgi:hypothetical protein